ncbi:MAG: hypothetical protein ACYCYP_12775 [Leptospirales bacterium]
MEKAKWTTQKVLPTRLKGVRIVIARLHPVAVWQMKANFKDLRKGLKHPTPPGREIIQ